VVHTFHHPWSRAANRSLRIKGNQRYQRDYTINNGSHGNNSWPFFSTGISKNILTHSLLFISQLKSTHPRQKTAKAKHNSTYTMYRFASAFPGAIFTIPCDAPPAYNLVESTSTQSDAALDSHASYFLSPAPSSSTIASADIGRLDCNPSPTTSTHTPSWSDSTAEDDSAHGSDWSPERPTWGRRPRFSDLGPMIDIVSPWDIGDAWRVFGETLRYGDRIRPDTPSSSRTISERADSPMQEATTAPPTASSTPSKDFRSVDVQVRGELVNTAPVVRPAVARSGRLSDLMRANGLRIQTQNVSGYYRMPTLMK
jgi:hypothetical protein